MRRKTEGLTKKQKEVLDFIKKFHAENKYPPSIRQICSAIDLSSPATVHVHVNHLVEKGYIKRSAEGNRAMELLVPNEYENKGKEVVSIPLLNNENIEDPIKELETPKVLIDVPTYLIPKKKEIFAFKVNDNRMINKGILPNDIILVERISDVKSGNIAITLDNSNKLTLNTLYKEKGQIRLQPENDTMTPTILDDVKVLGRTIGLYRKY